MESRSSSSFELLGLPEQYELATDQIERAFFDRSKTWHPDRFASAPAAERVAALSRSRALNDAYLTLKKPVPRAEYLLGRAGVTIGDNERLDPEFLMEILELREELAEHKADATKVAALQADMLARRTAAVAALAPLFRANDLVAIKRTLIVLRYLDRYLEECDVALDED